MRRRHLVTLALIAVLAAILLGPREPVDTAIRPTSLPALPALEAAIATAESGVANLRPGAQKRIVWSDPARPAPTPIAIVYLHGFSASPEEIRPLPDDVAGALGANLFFARLAGHGRDGAALGAVRVNDWINDLAEAIETGRRLGDRVVLIGASTGASLLAWAAVRPDLVRDVAALVLISPNFGLADPAARLLTLPWAEHLVGLVVGPEYAFEPANAEQARWWTTRYPARALLPMAETAQLAREAPLGEAALPALFIYSPRDEVVAPALIEDAYDRWGGGKSIIQVTDSKVRAQHVIAGRIMSPETTPALAERIVDWLAGQL